MDEKEFEFAIKREAMNLAVRACESGLSDSIEKIYRLIYRLLTEREQGK